MLTKSPQKLTKAHKSAQRRAKARQKLAKARQSGPKPTRGGPRWRTLARFGALWRALVNFLQTFPPGRRKSLQEAHKSSQRRAKAHKSAPKLAKARQSPHAVARVGELWRTLARFCELFAKLSARGPPPGHPPARPGRAVHVFGDKVEKWQPTFARARATALFLYDARPRKNTKAMESLRISENRKFRVKCPNKTRAGCPGIRDFPEIQEK